MLFGRLFISSVFGGLLDLRAAAAAAAKLAGFEPVLTETHVAQPLAVRDALTREIDACDTYLGLFDQRRGTVPKTGTADHRAITEEELRLARERGLRCLVFLSRDAAGTRDPRLTEFLDREVTDYAAGLWTRPYDGEAGLRREIVAALAALRPRLVLALEAQPSAAPGAFQASLDLRPLGPAWAGPAAAGPLPADLHLDPGTTAVLAAFRHGEDARNRLDPAALQVAGAALAGTLPSPLRDALAQVLDMTAGRGRLVLLEVRSADSGVLGLPWELLSLPGHPLPVREGLLEIVRRVVLPGTPAAPALEPATAVPADRLDVLGFTASPIEDQQEGAGLGNAGLTGDSDLFWEREQERLLVALDGLVRQGRGRLTLPETGDRDELRRELARPDRPQLVHLACHGGTRPATDGAAEPVLYLEDVDAHRAAIGPGELLGWCRATPTAADLELMVLAACSTASAPAAGRAGGTAAGLRAAAATPPPPEEAPPARGFAERLVRGGVPRVLAMQSVTADEGRRRQRVSTGSKVSVARRVWGKVLQLSHVRMRPSSKMNSSP